MFAPGEELWSSALQQERSQEEVWIRKSFNLRSNWRLSPNSECYGSFVLWASFTLYLLLLLAAALSSEILSISLSFALFFWAVKDVSFCLLSGTSSALASEARGPCAGCCARGGLSSDDRPGALGSSVLSLWECRWSQAAVKDLEGAIHSL